MEINSMKKVLAGAGGVTALALVGVGVFGAPEASAQATGIKGTKHNLGTSQPTASSNQMTGTSATGEICVFCHTPHGADTSAAVPLWNRALPAAANFTTYNSLGTSSLDGSTVQVGSVSIACLSCHDGVQAMNTVLNQSGSGGYVPTTGSAMSGTWAGSTVNTDGTLKAGITNIGRDLTNDHPVGIQYAGGPAAGKSIPTAPNDYTNTLFKDPDFNTAKSLPLNGQTVWWVETGNNATRDKTDMLLYTRGGSATGQVDAQVVNRDGTVGAQLATVQPFVECASCHDPHSTNPTFLRVVNTGSAVCLACHIK